MKYLIILMFLLVGCSEDSQPTVQQDWGAKDRIANAFAASLEVGECFRYEAERKAKFSFEKDYTYLGKIHVVMAKDPDALMIAQPEPNCRVTSENSHKCEYWFRTVPFADRFLIHGGEKKIKCPKQLSMDKMKQRLKNSIDSIEYKLDAR